MKQTSTALRRSLAPQQRPRATPVAAACVLALLAAGAAQAQQTDTVTVTGIRAAIESAISLKKGAESIVEAISAEDLGKLPDTSMAESISRLPGVAAQRTGGRQASQISMRGMAPDFSTTLLNGREVASVGRQPQCRIRPVPGGAAPQAC
jgi:iron complex outermembrane receptor protein